MKKSMIISIIFLLCVLPLFSADWDLISKIVASDRNDDDFFSTDIAISGNYAIIGAYREDQNIDEGGALVDAGAAYIFQFNGSEWEEMQKLVAPVRAEDDLYGYSVDICGNYAIVGSHQENVGGIPFAGAAYIYYYDGSNWVENDKLLAWDREIGDHFGYSVALSEDRALIGAIYEDDNAVGGDSVNCAGSAYVFLKSDSAWTQEKKLVADYRDPHDYFGHQVAIDGDYIVVSTPYEDHDENDINYESSSGAVYVFKNYSSGWNQQQKIVASDRDLSDYFGHCVDIDENYIAVGAYMEDHDPEGANRVEKAGSVYIYKRYDNPLLSNPWVEQQKIVASERWASDFFGHGVALENDILIVGASGEDHDTLAANYIANAGAAYIFKNIDGNWLEQEKITEPYRREDDAFGNDVAISGDVVLVSAPANDLNAEELDLITSAGAAYLFSTGIGGILVPDIYVHADSVEIIHGDNTPSLIENTDFGTVYLDSGAVTRTYSISNTGTGCLMIDSIYVHDSWGVNFIVSAPAPDSLAPGASGSFSISFTPSDTSLRIGTVNIESNDPDEGLYLFAVKAKGIQAEVSIDLVLPAEFSLLPAHPNPFNPITTISYHIPETSDLEIEVFDMNGKQITSLYHGDQESGRHELSWDAGDLPSGIYIVRMVAGEFIGTQKLVLIK